ncbi:hypothetical protein HK104_002429 [Borealophlyctis nickersoniae]|nr:hypothetical protein HK104_002429 [Borealophlyctis nickersoniae]
MSQQLEHLLQYLEVECKQFEKDATLTRTARVLANLPPLDAENAEGGKENVEGKMSGGDGGTRGTREKEKARMALGVMASNSGPPVGVVVSRETFVAVMAGTDCEAFDAFYKFCQTRPGAISALNFYKSIHNLESAIASLIPFYRINRPRSHTYALERFLFSHTQHPPLPTRKLSPHVDIPAEVIPQVLTTYCDFFGTSTPAQCLASVLSRRFGDEARKKLAERMQSERPLCANVFDEAVQAALEVLFEGAYREFVMRGVGKGKENNENEGEREERGRREVVSEDVKRDKRGASASGRGGGAGLRRWGRVTLPAVLSSEAEAVVAAGGLGNRRHGVMMGTIPAALMVLDELAKLPQTPLPPVPVGAAARGGKVETKSDVFGTSRPNSSSTDSTSSYADLPNTRPETDETHVPVASHTLTPPPTPEPKPRKKWPLPPCTPQSLAIIETAQRRQQSQARMIRALRMRPLSPLPPPGLPPVPPTPDPLYPDDSSSQRDTVPTLDSLPPPPNDEVLPTTPSFSRPSISFSRPSTPSTYLTPPASPSPSPTSSAARSSTPSTLFSSTIQLWMGRKGRTSGSTTSGSEGGEVEKERRSDSAISMGSNGGGGGGKRDSGGGGGSGSASAGKRDSGGKKGGFGLWL